MSSKTTILWDIFLLCVYAAISVLIAIKYLEGSIRAPWAVVGVIVFGFGAFRQWMFVKRPDVPDDTEGY